MRWLVVAALSAAASLLGEGIARAGPELSLREFASSQIKKGVRSIGMGGDGATFGNYSLIYRDAGSAVADYGLVHFNDTGNQFTFTAIGLSSPRFWDDAVLYVIAMSQHALGEHVWTVTAPSRTKPPSTGDGANQAVFVKFAKPITETLSAGVLLSYELSQMTLTPDGGGAPITYHTAWRPSGGFGVTWEPSPMFLFGLRALLSNDWETRTDGTGRRGGFARSYEYRVGGAFMPWDGGILDLGVAALDRSNGLDGTSSFKLGPVIGAEQALVPKHLWLRAGFDESAWTFGASGAIAPFKLDLALLRDLAIDRTGEVFGKSDWGGFATLTFDYERVIAGREPPAPGGRASSPK